MEDTNRISSSPNDPAEYSGLTELRLLGNIISDSIVTIDKTLKERKLDFPTLDTPFTVDSEAGRTIPEVQDALSLIIGAASQLVATVRSPPLTVSANAMLINIPPALNVVVEMHVAEILREAGPKGASGKEIASHTGIDPSKLSRLLRLLATRHIFKEVSPDVFAHNRTSSVLDTGKSVEVLVKTSGINKHLGDRGFTAVVGHLADESMKTMSYLTEFFLDRDAINANDIHNLPFNRGLSATKNIWEFFDLPDQVYRRERFGVVMEGSSNLAPPRIIAEGMDWDKLRDGALVVDVGGGVGTQSLTLSKEYKHLRIEVQDREQVIKDAKEFWAKENPEAVNSGRVVLKVHDFWKPQIQNDVDVYLIRMILHDYPDHLCRKILGHLHNAAKPTTQLVVIDNIMPYACDEPAASRILGAKQRTTPKPLISNFGEARITSYCMDVLMMGLTGGQERTLTQVVELLASAKWKVARVSPGSHFGLSDQKVIAVPMY